MNKKILSKIEKEIRKEEVKAERESDRLERESVVTNYILDNSDTCFWIKIILSFTLLLFVLSLTLFLKLNLNNEHHPILGLTCSILAIISIIMGIIYYNYRKKVLKQLEEKFIIIIEKKY